MKLKCQCCGFEAEFADGEAAFQAGWDAPPYFSGVICCHLCPASFIVLGETHRHAKAHEQWKTQGRPEEFEIPT